MMYIYVNDRINIVNSELNSPRFSEGNLIIIKYGIIYIDNIGECLLSSSLLLFSLRLKLVWVFGMINDNNNVWNVNSNGNFDNNNYDNDNDNEAGARPDYFDTLL